MEERSLRVIERTVACRDANGVEAISHGENHVLIGRGLLGIREWFH